MSFFSTEIFSKELFVRHSCEIPDHFSIFEANVAAIKVVVDILLRCAAAFRLVCIHSDSIAVILSLSSLTVCSKFNQIIELSYSIIRLVWIRGHNGIAGNCKADELAINGILISISVEPMGLVKALQAMVNNY